MARQRSSMVAYSSSQSMEKPRRLKSSLYVFSSSAVTMWQSSMKFSREMTSCSSLSRSEFFAALADVEVWDVWDVWFGSDAEVVLDAALCGEAVVVPAHGIDDVPSGHAAVSCNDVLVGVGEYVPGME